MPCVRQGLIYMLMVGVRMESLTLASVSPVNAEEKEILHRRPSNLSRSLPLLRHGFSEGDFPSAAGWSVAGSLSRNIDFRADCASWRPGPPRFLMADPGMYRLASQG